MRFGLLVWATGPRLDMMDEGVCAMNQNILRQHLAEAERHVARGVVHLAQQEALIAELE